MSDVEMKEFGAPATSVVKEGSTGEDGTAAGEHGKIMSAFGIFTIVVIIVLIGITALFATNTYFFERIKSSGCNGKISASEANTLYWVNLVMAIISGILALVAIIMLVVYWRKPKFTKKWLGTASYQAPTVYGEKVAAGRMRAAQGIRYGGERAAGFVGPTPGVIVQ